MSLHDLCSHFTLHSHPFGRAVPDAGLLRHRSFDEALNRLLFAVETRTPALLTAEPGTGKSTLLAYLSATVDAPNTRLLYTALSSCRPFALVGQLAVRYGVPLRRSGSLTAQSVLDELAKSDKREILVLDEAHRLPRESLDELRLISNTDFDRVPPFALLLAGQPPLRERLAEPALASLWERLAVRASLAPLTESETADYLERRLRAAGARAMLFRPAAVAKLFEYSRGICRRLNNLATSALLAAAATGRKHVEPVDVDNAHFDLESN
jgi:type II secretory pathway predicted ATPase ExeA